MNEPRVKSEVPCLRLRLSTHIQKPVAASARRESRVVSRERDRSGCVFFPFRFFLGAQGGVTTRSTPRRASCRANRAASSHVIYVASAHLAQVGHESCKFERLLRRPTYIYVLGLRCATSIARDRAEPGASAPTWNGNHRGPHKAALHKPQREDGKPTSGRRRRRWDGRHAADVVLYPS